MSTDHTSKLGKRRAGPHSNWFNGRLEYVSSTVDVQYFASNVVILYQENDGSNHVIRAAFPLQ